MDRARRNLAYTSIYAPIDGIVVERNVDVGQTVAASLSAPQLFLIANDLSEMWILASVDESDIGTIAEGQPVRFTVQAYPSRTFNGVVRQVRLQSAVTENVVNYTVVIDVKNTDGKLLRNDGDRGFSRGICDRRLPCAECGAALPTHGGQIAKLGDSAAVQAQAVGAAVTAPAPVRLTIPQGAGRTRDGTLAPGPTRA